MTTNIKKKYIIWTRHTWWPPPPPTRHTSRRGKTAAKFPELLLLRTEYLPRLRPHVKTHKTIEGCIIQAGIDSAGDESLADVVRFVASTLPVLAMIVKLGCQYKRKPFTDVIFGIPICKSKLLSIHNQCHTSWHRQHTEKVAFMTSSTTHNK